MEDGLFTKSLLKFAQRKYEFWHGIRPYLLVCAMTTYITPKLGENVALGKCRDRRTCALSRPAAKTYYLPSEPAHNLKEQDESRIAFQISMLDAF
jgi:hypothetical protein